MNEVLEALGTQTLTIHEFHALMSSRWSPMQKANATKRLQMDGHITVRLWRENGETKSEVKRA